MNSSGSDFYKPTKYIEVVGKKALRLVIGTSRVATEKTADGNFVARRNNDDEEIDILKFAIRQGLNFIDTARVYGDAEIIIGKAIRGFQRNRLVIATKAGFDLLNPKQFRREVEQSIDRLKTVPDVVFIHDRHEGHMESELDELIEELDVMVNKGIIRSIGISNFKANELERAIKKSRNGISAYQARVNLYNPRSDSKELIDLCKKYGIPFMASSALDRGKLMDEVSSDLVRKMNEKYGMTPAQLGIYILLIHGLLPIVRSHNKKHIKENIQTFDIKISQEDVDTLSKIFSF